MNSIPLKTFIVASALFALSPLVGGQTFFSAAPALADQRPVSPTSSGSSGLASPIDSDIAAKMERSTGTKEKIKNKRPMMRDRSCYPNCEATRGKYY